MGLERSRWIEIGLPSMAAIAGVLILGAWTRSALAPIRVEPRAFGSPSKPVQPPAQPQVTTPPDPIARPQQVSSSHSLTEVLPGNWPGFRGPNGDNIGTGSKVPAGVSGIRKVWEVPMGEGYAGPAVSKGRVYLLDYDEAAKSDLLRCFSLASGQELWRNGYTVDIKRNHGISRTVPATDGNVVVSLGPKCHVLAADAETGKTLWTADLVKEYGTVVPEWYAGQCPVIDDGKVILAPGGSSLVVALDLKTGKPIWKTANPNQWDMTHSSIAVATLAGKKQYVYCGSGGVVGVSAQDGKILWEFKGWTVDTATVPTPVPIPGDRLFLSGGYNSGSMMLSLVQSTPKVLWTSGPETFGSDQQTPILFKDHLFGVAPGGELVCLNLDGKAVWRSGSEGRFGLGPYMIADDKVILLNDSGNLTVAEASTTAYRSFGSVRVLQGRESWGPMALAGNRLLVRDSTSLACLQLGVD